MKRMITAAFFAAFATVTLQAQGLRVTATIPFDFHACNRVLPAGEYMIETQGPVVVVKHRDTGKDACMALRNSTTDKSNPPYGRLTFSRYGENYFLRSVWDGTSSTGIEIPVSHVEKELIAKSKRRGGPEPTVLALSRK